MRDDRKGMLDQFKGEINSGKEHIPLQEWIGRFILGSSMIHESVPKKDEEQKSGEAKHVNDPDDVKTVRQQYNDFKGLIADINKARLQSEFVSDFPDITDLLSEIEGIDQIYEDILNKLGIRPILGQIMQCILELTGIPQGLGYLCRETIGQIPTDEFLKIFKRQSEGGFVPDVVFSSLDKGLAAIPPNLNKELQATAQRNEINKFIKQLEEFLDFDKLCEDIEELATKLPDMAMGPNGIKRSENNINAAVPQIPEPPAITFPESLTTDDLEKAAMKDVEQQSRRLVMEALREAITIILELLLKYCRQGVEDLWGAEDSEAQGANSPKSRANINELIEDTIDSVLTASPTIELPKIRRAALAAAGARTSLDDDDLGDFFDKLSSALTPKQICALLYGEPSEKSLKIIKQVILSHQKFYKEFAPNILEKENIKKLFKELGKYVDKEICDDAVEEYDTVVRESIQRLSEKPLPCPPEQDSSAGGPAENPPQSGPGDIGEDDKEHPTPVTDEQLSDVLQDAFDDLSDLLLVTYCSDCHSRVFFVFSDTYRDTIDVKVT